MVVKSKGIINLRFSVNVIVATCFSRVFLENIRETVCRLILLTNLLMMSFIFQKRLSAKQAKNKVFEHWKDLESFAKKRFPSDENQAIQALDYSLALLQEDDWMRVCQWQGKGRFLTFLLTLTAHLMTDYTRKQFGHHRPPKWLLEKSDKLWIKAYKLLAVERYNRFEAIEILKAEDQDISVITAVVEEILKKSQIKNHQPKFSSDDEFEQLGSLETEPLKELILTSNDQIEILIQFLASNGDCQLPDYLKEHISRLKSSVTLNEEDRMLLYLRYVEGMNMNNIVKFLNLAGNPYKRVNKLIEKLQDACEQAGLISDQADLDK